MTENDSNEKVMDHEYDGIQELDNQLPKWWLLLLYVTIVWSAGYWYYYEMGGGGPSSIESYEMGMQELASKKQNANQATAEANPSDLNSLVSNKEALASGAKEFQLKCASCHGKIGEGSIGPNLTDSFWLHGDGKMESIITVIKKGVLEKGMPPWEAVIPVPMVNNLAAYIVSIQGTNPPKAKAPQGKEIKN